MESGSDRLDDLRHIREGIQRVTEGHMPNIVYTCAEGAASLLQAGVIAADSANNIPGEVSESLARAGLEISEARRILLRMGAGPEGVAKLPGEPRR